jgi:uncharacterized protein (TIGR02246 family)
MKALNLSLVVLGAGALALPVGGCGQHSGAKADPAAIANTIKADEKKWNDQFKAKDQEALLAHYADDAFFVAPGAPAANGSTEIAKAYAQGLADHYFSLSFQSDKVDVAASGDLAYSRGHFTESHQDPKSHQIVTESGSYLTVYKKQPDGSWKAVEDFAAADPGTRKEKSPVVKGPRMISLGL